MADPTDLPAPSRLDPRPELPDPFEFLDGTTVETRGDWDDRRTELRQLFRHYVYGYVPDPPELDVSVDETAGVLDGAATLREVTIRFADLPDDAPAITLALFLPATGETDPKGASEKASGGVASREGAVPTVLGLNREGNHAAVADDAVTVTTTAEAHGADERGAQTDYWCVEYILGRGYGFATYHCADVDPDRDDFTDGLHPYFDDDLPGPPGTEWGTLAAWAWGLGRCVDYLRTDDAVRGDEIAVTGHSRRGKAALLAGATDERIGLVAPHQSGTGGMALSRDNGQETVARINATFPHWFNDVFPAFGDAGATFGSDGEREAKLPVDQHHLAALVAPRPLIDTEGARDYWANPGRALDCLQAADPVYEFLGVEGLTGDEPLYGDDEISDETVGRLLQYRRETEHTLNRGYWEAILDFADVHFES
jgi:hypothetical protein